MDRMRVVLLDDEALIRKLIRMKMNIEELNLEIVGEFSNAIKALEALSELQPDILISDICMPDMDGISFSEQCMQRYPDVKVIIVTGYNDFEYARRSLKAGVYDYIMKPVQTEELNKTLEKAVNQILSERKVKEEQTKILQQRKQDLPLLRSTYLRSLLLEQERDTANETKLKEYGVDVELAEEYGMKAGVLVIKENILHPELIGKIKKEAESFFENDKEIYVVLDPWGRVVIICGGDTDSFEKCFHLLVEIIEKKWEVHVQFGYFEGQCGYEELKAVYLQALEDMHKRYDKQRIKKEEKIISREVNWEELFLCIKQGRTTEALEKLDMGIYQLKIHHQERRLTKMELAGVLRIFGEACDMLPLMETALAKLELCHCEKDGIQCVRNYVMNASMRYAMQIDKSKGKFMSEVIGYIENHLNDEDLSMNLLINKFSVSSSYLNRMFKRFAGMPYSEFVSDLRFWRMLKLLSDNYEMLDWEIGSAVGIKDAHYFCIWFKKMTGLSMTEYRKQQY